MIILLSILLSILTLHLSYDFISKYVDTTSTYVYIIILFIYSVIGWSYIIEIIKNKKLLIDNRFKILYIATIILTLFFRIPDETVQYNLKPLFLDPYFIIDFVFIFNLVIFIPFCLLFRSKWYYVITMFIGIELLQYTLHLGSFDINDIILYTTGYFIGTCLQKIDQ